jgi:hypothetical protein
VARPDGDQALEQLLKRHALARPRLPGRRHAAGHRRHPAHAGAEGAGHRRGDRHHAAGHRPARRAQGPQDVREGRRAHPRHRREHEHPHLLEVRPRGAHLRRAGGGERMARTTASSCWALPLDIRIREQADGGKPTVVADPDGRRSPRSTAHRAPRGREGRREGQGHDGEVPQHRHPEHLKQSSAGESAARRARVAGPHIAPKERIIRSDPTPVS